MNARTSFRNSNSRGERRARTCTASSTVSEFLHAGLENEVHHSIEDGWGWAWARAGFYVLEYTLSGDIEMDISISISYKFELHCTLGLVFVPFLHSGWSGLE